MPKTIPDDDIEEGPNLTDTNGAAGAMDEDGEYDPEGEDVSPVIQRLTIAVLHPKGGMLQTDVRAVIHTETGLLDKRMVIPGHATAKQLGVLLADIAGR